MMNTNIIFIILFICIIVQEIQIILMGNKVKKIEDLVLASLLGKIAKIIHHDMDSGETEIIKCKQKKDKTGEE